MRYPELYKEVCSRPGVITLPGFFNPIKVEGKAITVYAFKCDEVYEGYFDKRDLKRIVTTSWTVHGFNEHRTTGYFHGAGGKYMHDMLMKPPDGLVVDHINGNGLDNRRCNLRIVSHRINMINRKLHSNSSTGIDNVHITEKGIFQVCITRKFYNKEVAQAAAEEVAAILKRYAFQDEEV